METVNFKLSEWEKFSIFQSLITLCYNWITFSMPKYSGEDL